MPKTCLDETGAEIVKEIYVAVSRVTDDAGLLSIIGSWGDTMDDRHILDMLRELDHPRP